MKRKYKIILWDFGGVLTKSPIKNFTSYEKKNDLKLGTIIKINSTNHLNNAWALLEKNQISLKQFSIMFKEEAAALGIKEIIPELVLECLNVGIDKEMYKMFTSIRKNYKCACLTNNINYNYLPFKKNSFEELKGHFSYIFESNKLGTRKPEEKIYKIVIEKLNVLPEEILFLDDLGINLKPAKKLGINTYKVTDINKSIKFLKNELQLIT